MTTAATIKSRLILDTSDYDEGISRSKKKADSFSSKMKGVGKSMMTTGAKMTAGLTLPIVAAGVKMVDFAADAEEAVNAVNVVFGEGAEALLDYSKTSATTTGESAANFNQMSAEMGAMLKNVGLPIDEVTDKTIELMERSADMASIFNTDTAQAFNAVKSAIKGEFNPLEQFGVKMLASNVAAKALEMGLIENVVSVNALEKAQIGLIKAQEEADKVMKEFGNNSFESREAQNKLAIAMEKVEKVSEGVSGELTESAKATAALAIVMEQTEQFAGDFQNTADGVTNSTKIMKAQFADAAADLGTQLLPIAQKLIGFLSDLIGKFTALTPEQQKMILMFAGILAAIGPVVTIIGGLVSVIGAIAGVSAAVLAPILAIIAVVALLALAWKTDFGGIRTFLIGTWEKMKPILAAWVEWLKVVIPQAIQALKQFWTDVLLPKIQFFWAWVKTNILPLLANLAKFFGSIIFTAVKALAGLWQNVLFPALSTLWGWFKEKILPILRDVSDWLQDKLRPAFDAITTAIQGVSTWLGTMADKIMNLELPDWLTPGSPTPLEMGLKGINDQMALLQRKSMPDFGTGVNLGVGSGMGGNILQFGGIKVIIQGNADEQAVKRGVNLGIQEALRAGGRA
jgi:hypothetical protein